LFSCLHCRKVKSLIIFIYVFPLPPYTCKLVLLVLQLVCWATTRHQNKLLLELNGYEQRPMAALIKSWVEILIKLQVTKFNILLAKYRWGHSKTKLENNNQEFCWEEKLGGVGRGKTLLPQRVKDLNDATATGCAIVTHVPRGDIHWFCPMTSMHTLGCCHATRNAR